MVAVVLLCSVKNYVLLLFSFYEGRYKGDSFSEFSSNLTGDTGQNDDVLFGEDGELKKILFRCLLDDVDIPVEVGSLVKLLLEKNPDHTFDDELTSSVTSILNELHSVHGIIELVEMFISNKKRLCIVDLDRSKLIVHNRTQFDEWYCCCCCCCLGFPLFPGN